MLRADPVCAWCEDPENRAIRFSLIRNTTRAFDGKPTSRSCGSLFLCERCWREIRIVTRRYRRKSA